MRVNSFWAKTFDFFSEQYFAKLSAASNFNRGENDTGYDTRGALARDGNRFNDNCMNNNNKYDLLLLKFRGRKEEGKKKEREESYA